MVPFGVGVIAQIAGATKPLAIIPVYLGVRVEEGVSDLAAFIQECWMKVKVNLLA